MILVSLEYSHTENNEFEVGVRKELHRAVSAASESTVKDSIKPSMDGTRTHGNNECYNLTEL